MRARLWLLPVAAVAALALTSAALAASTYKGHLNGHSKQKVSFVKSGSTVTKFTLTNVIVTCDGGTQHINPSFTVSAPINSSDHFKAVGGPVTFKGDIAGNDATGTLIVDGSFSGSSQNCSLDKKWTASS